MRAWTYSTDTYTVTNVGSVTVITDCSVAKHEVCMTSEELSNGLCKRNASAQDKTAIEELETLRYLPKSNVFDVVRSIPQGVAKIIAVHGSNVEHEYLLCRKEIGVRKALAKHGSLSIRNSLICDTNVVRLVLAENPTLLSTPVLLCDRYSEIRHMALTKCELYWAPAMLDDEDAQIAQLAQFRIDNSI